MPSELPTIAHVDAERGFSGGEVQVFLLMEGLRARGWRNVLFCPPSSQAERRARERGFEVRAIEMRNDLDLGAARALARGLRECGAALAHLHTGRAHWLGGLAARRAHVPAVVTRRMDKPLRSRRRARSLYERLARRTVAISATVERQLLEAGVARARVVHVPSAVDPAALAPRRSSAEVRAELGAGPDEMVLLVVGQLVGRKGQDLAIEALGRLRGEGREATLWLAGEGPERAELEAAARERGLADVVRFLGRREDVPDLLGACDALVMPSRAEGLGVAALEAMAAERPVVAASVGGLAETVVHEGTGLLVEPGDPAALAAALARLVSDADLRRRLGRAGPARVAERWTAEQMVASYDALYREVLAEQGPATSSASGSASGRVRVSACIIAFEEADRIEECIASLAWCDEVLVVDSRSTDSTRELAAAAGARVIERDWPGHVAQKEFAIRAAEHDWVLCIDSDERVSPALREEILALRERGFPDHAGWSMPRLSSYLGAWVRHGSWYPDRQLRLFDRRRGRWGGHDPHDRVELEGPPGRLSGDLWHHPYRSLSEHLQTIDKYTTIMAQGLHERGKRARWHDLLTHGLARFVRFYLLKSGWLLGWRGFLLACLAFHYGQQKYAKLLALQADTRPPQAPPP